MRSTDPTRIRTPWMPAFESALGGPITHEDSVVRTPGVALGLLKAIALPDDLRNVPADPLSTVDELAQSLIMVCGSPFLSVCPDHYLI